MNYNQAEPSIFDIHDGAGDAQPISLMSKISDVLNKRTRQNAVGAPKVLKQNNHNNDEIKDVISEQEADRLRKKLQDRDDVLKEEKGQEDSDLSLSSDKEQSSRYQKKRVLKVWIPEEDQLLMYYYKKFAGKWDKIALQIPGRNASQCAQRYRRLNPQRVRTHWTEEEDEIVIKMVKKFGKNWGLIASNLEGRNGKQVRERYINCLDPSINWKSFTKAEDRVIWNFYQKNGAKWSELAKLLAGRPENMIKNRYYAHLKRLSDIGEIDKGCSDEEGGGGRIGGGGKMKKLQEEDAILTKIRKQIKVQSKKQMKVEAKEPAPSHEKLQSKSLRNKKAKKNVEEQRFQSSEEEDNNNNNNNIEEEEENSESMEVSDSEEGAKEKGVYTNNNSIHNITSSLMGKSKKKKAESNNSSIKNYVNLKLEREDETINNANSILNHNNNSIRQAPLLTPNQYATNPNMLIDMKSTQQLNQNTPTIKSSDYHGLFRQSNDNQNDMFVSLQTPEIIRNQGIFSFNENDNNQNSFRPMNGGGGDNYSSLQQSPFKYISSSLSPNISIDQIYKLQLNQHQYQVQQQQQAQQQAQQQSQSTQQQQQMINYVPMFPSANFNQAITPNSKIFSDLGKNRGFPFNTLNSSGYPSPSPRPNLISPHLFTPGMPSSIRGGFQNFWPTNNNNTNNNTNNNNNLAEENVYRQPIQIENKKIQPKIFDFKIALDPKNNEQEQTKKETTKPINKKKELKLVVTQDNKDY